MRNLHFTVSCTCILWAMLGSGVQAFAAQAFVSPDGRLRANLDGHQAVISYDGKTAVTVIGLGKDAECRATNAGFVWRETGDAAYTFNFAEDARCWPVSHAQGKYVPRLISQIGTQAPIPGFAPVANGKRMYNYDQRYLVPGSCEAPLVVEKKNGPVVALGDAAVYGGARLRFVKGEGLGQVKSYLEGPGPHDEPSWKYVRVAENPAALYNGNDLLTSLCRPCTDPKLTALGKSGPGKVLRVSKLTTEGALQCIDFVKTHGLTYIELDAGWYGNEQTGDPLKPGLAPEKVARGDKFDLLTILAAAKAKGVPVILYVNRVPLMKNHVAILDQLKAWGVAGVKYGFLGVGSAAERAWAFILIQEAAKRGLLVDIHDEMRLTGEQRTYPNVMTVEGIHGNEEMPTADHNAALVFTRYLTGPGDYTPCWKISRLQTTCAHQLAMAAAYTSPWQFLYWYARPNQIREDPALAFWTEIPTVFDETKALAGEIGQYAVVARRVGKRWYVGALNGLTRRSFTLDTSFLGVGKWSCRLFRDADPTLTKGLGKVTVERVNVQPKMTIDMAARGGFAAIFEQE